MDDSITAKDIMTTDVVTFKKDVGVKEAAKIFAERHIGGAPVVDEDDRLIGLISESDLISQDVKLKFPTFVHLLDSYIFLQSQRHFEEKLRRAAAAKVGELMSEDVYAVTPETSVEEIATRMVEKQIGRIPVIDTDRRIVGIITKGDIVRTLAR